MFVQFVALCYYEYFGEEIRKLKSILNEEIRSDKHTNEELKITKKLLTWINNTPLYLQLQWFDTIEQVKISSKLRNRRWNTEVTSCDALYLKKLELPYPENLSADYTTLWLTDKLLYRVSL